MSDFTFESPESVEDSDTDFLNTAPVTVSTGAYWEKCTECGFEAKNESGYKRHYTRKHTDYVPGDSKPKGMGRKSDLEKEIAEMFATVGVMVAFYDQFDGVVIAQAAEQQGRAWARLARSNPAVDKTLRKMIAGTAYSDVITASLAMMIPILGHHGVLPEQIAMAFAPTFTPPSPEGSSE